MQVLFIHQNFPGQFRHLSTALASQPGNRVVGLGEEHNVVRQRGSTPGVHLASYTLPRRAGAETHHYLRGLEENVLRAQAVVRACQQLKQKGFTPELIFAHAGWGEALYLKDVFPGARVVGYFEYYYHAQGGDVGFDPEFPPQFDDLFKLRTRNATHLLSLAAVDRGWSPTAWQQGLFPAEYRSNIEIIHEGIDTDVARPDPAAHFTTPSGITLGRSDEVLTLVNRNLEPHRGFHTFMRALPEILRQRPRAHTLIIGGEDVSYGRPPAKAANWKQAMLDEVGAELDLNRVHFLGKVPYADYLKVLQVSRAHAYFTYPFVLSWSLLESMAAGCTVIASATPPVLEASRDGETALLFDFFDQRQFVEHTVNALTSPEDFRMLGLNARQHVIEHYDLKRKCLPAQVGFAQRLLG